MSRMAFPKTIVVEDETVRQAIDVDCSFFFCFITGAVVDCAVFRLFVDIVKLPLKPPQFMQPEGSV